MHNAINFVNYVPTVKRKVYKTKIEICKYINEVMISKQIRYFVCFVSNFFIGINDYVTFLLTSKIENQQNRKPTESYGQKSTESLTM